MPLTAVPGHGLLRSLVAVGISLAVLAAASTAPAAVLTASNPSSGSRVDALDQIELTFSGPVDFTADGVRVVAPDGSTAPVTGIEPSGEDAIRVSIGEVGKGLRALTFSGVDSATGDPVVGSVAYAVGTPAPILDTERALSAASGAELAVALTVVALVVAIAAMLVLIAGSRRARRGDQRPTVIPIPAIIVGAGAVAVLGSVIGVAMGVRGRAAVSAGSALEAFGSSPFALWSVGALGIGVAIILLAGRLRRGRVGLATASILILGSLIVTIGMATAAQPAPPSDPVAVRALLDNGGQVSLDLAPGAVGVNTATVQMGGLGDDLGAPILQLRPLDGSIGPLRVPLTTAAGGDFVAADVLLLFPGRWRAQIEGVPGITEEDPALFDFDIQSAPEQ